MRDCIRLTDDDELRITSKHAIKANCGLLLHVSLYAHAWHVCSREFYAREYRIDSCFMSSRCHFLSLNCLFFSEIHFMLTDRKRSPD